MKILRNQHKSQSENCIIVTMSTIELPKCHGYLNSVHISDYVHISDEILYIPDYFGLRMYVGLRTYLGYILILN